MPRGQRERNQFGLLTVEELFCHEYINQRFNGTRAYLAAVSSDIAERSATDLASRLLKKPEIKARIHTLFSDKLARIDISTNDIVEELARLATFNILELTAYSGPIRPPNPEQIGHPIRFISAA